MPGLIEALKDEQTDVRLHAITALGELGDARATQPLVLALKDSEPRVRGRAASALGEIRDRATVEALIPLVRDSNVDVRRRAIRALAEIRDANAIPALTAALKDDDAGVRRAAVMALAELGGGDDPEHSRATQIHGPTPIPIRIRTPIRNHGRARLLVGAADRVSQLARSLCVADGSPHGRERPGRGSERKANRRRARHASSPRT